MVNAVCNGFYMAIEHRGICPEPRRMNLPRELQPAIRITLMSADHGPRRLTKNLGAAPGTRVQTGFKQLLNHVFVGHLVKMCEMVQLHHCKCFQVQEGVALFYAREEICEITKRKLGIQTTSDVHFCCAFAYGLISKTQTVFDIVRVSICLTRRAVEAAKFTIGIADVGGIEMPVDVEINCSSVSLSP